MGLTKLRSIFGAFFVPTWLHFASQNPPKTLQKPTPRRIKILIDVCIIFFSFWAPFWEPRISRIFPETAPGATQKRMNPLYAPPRAPQGPPYLQSAPREPPGTPSGNPRRPKGHPRSTKGATKGVPDTPKILRMHGRLSSTTPARESSLSARRNARSD